MCAHIRGLVGWHGAPRAGANVSLWIDYWEQSEWKREQRTAVTDADGIAEMLQDFEVRGDRFLIEHVVLNEFLK